MKEQTGKSSITKWSLMNNEKNLSNDVMSIKTTSYKGPSKAFEQAIRLEGTKTNQSKHAAE